MTEQNSPRQLQRLRAQRQLYTQAKKILGVQVVLAGPVAVGSAALVMAYPFTKGFCALWGIGVVLCDIFWLTPWQKHIRDCAARIQEAFDCDVLNLPWSDLKAGKRPDPELVKEQSDSYEKNASALPPLTNWYSPAVAGIPEHIGRLACQRSNCWWDAKQRRRYAVTVLSVVLLIFAGVLLLALANKLTVEDFILTVLAPLAPLLFVGLRQFREQMDAAERIDRLKDHAVRLWNEALCGHPEPAMTAQARALQDEILDHRRKSPLVFDFIFRRLRPSYETQMNFAVEELVEEAKKKLGIS